MSARLFLILIQMFEADLLLPEYSNLIGWRQHYDTTDFQIDASLVASETSEFYQQKHPALDLAIIRATMPSGQTLNTYLANKVKDSAVEMFNDILQYRQVNNYGKTLLSRSTLLNKLGWRNDTIINQNRFVGLQIRPKASTGLKLVIDEIGLQFTQLETFDIYLFHSSKEQFLERVSVTTDGGNAWKWEVQSMVLNAFEKEEYYGGVFVLGYYQDEISGNAINYSNFDWNKGECSSCNRSRYRGWQDIKRYFSVFPLYVPQGSYTKGEMFEIEDAFFVPDQSFGLNLRFTAECDLTQFFIDNKRVFKNLLSLKVTHKILNDMKFSIQTNHIEEQLKMMIIRDLEGDKETNYLNITQQYNTEMKAVQFNIGGISELCLPCEEAGTLPSVGTL